MRTNITFTGTTKIMKGQKKISFISGIKTNNNFILGSKLENVYITGTKKLFKPCSMVKFWVSLLLSDILLTGLLICITVYD